MTMEPTSGAKSSLARDITMSLFGNPKTKTKLTALVLEAAVKKEAFTDYVDDARKRYKTLSRWITKYGRQTLAGLGLLSLPKVEDVINESTELCKEYLLQRLGQDDLLSPRMDYLYGSTELSQKSKTFSSISNEIQNAASELESMHPELYGSVTKQLNLVLTSEVQARKTLLALAGHLYRGNMTWGKVIAGFSLAGAMACDCVRQGRPELVTDVVEIFSKITEDYTADWIVKQGGWVDLTQACRTTGEIPLIWAFSILGATIGFCVTLVSTVSI